MIPQMGNFCITHFNIHILLIFICLNYFTFKITEKTLLTIEKQRVTHYDIILCFFRTYIYILCSQIYLISG